MPELPEVETVKRQIEPQICGEEIVAVQMSGLNLRKKLGCSQRSLIGRKILKLSRWGKRIFIHFEETPLNLDVSLGMTGVLRLDKKGSRSLKHDHLTFKLGSGTKLVYHDPRRFGWVAFSESNFVCNGWDPILSSKKDFNQIVKQASASKKNIYSFLMDQKYIVGLGNIYVQEILFKSRISPFRTTEECSVEELETIRKNTQFILKKALRHGGSTIQSYKNAEGEKGAFQNKLKVYGKKKSEPCSVCKCPILHIVLARSISYCSNCQK